MTNHDNGDDNGYHSKNEDGNDYDNAASGSGSNDPNFDTIATPWSRLGLAEENWVTKTFVLRLKSHTYHNVGINLPYKHPINSIVNMYHKLIYAKIDILDLN